MDIGSLSSGGDCVAGKRSSTSDLLLALSMKVPGDLALDLIESRLKSKLRGLINSKPSRMKEIAFKRHAELELEEIFARAHIEIDPAAAREKFVSSIDSGNIEPTELLADMDNLIAKAKDEALSRKDILDKVQKSWLADYN